VYQLRLWPAAAVAGGGVSEQRGGGGMSKEQVVLGYIEGRVLAEWALGRAWQPCVGFGPGARHELEVHSY